MTHYYKLNLPDKHNTLVHDLQPKFLVKIMNELHYKLSQLHLGVRKFQAVHTTVFSLVLYICTLRIREQMLILFMDKTNKVGLLKTYIMDVALITV